MINKSGKRLLVVYMSKRCSNNICLLFVVYVVYTP